VASNGPVFRAAVACRYAHAPCSPEDSFDPAPISGIVRGVRNTLTWLRKACQTGCFFIEITEHSLGLLGCRMRGWVHPNGCGLSDRGSIAGFSHRIACHSVVACLVNGCVACASHCVGGLMSHHVIDAVCASFARPGLQAAACCWK